MGKKKNKKYQAKLYTAYVSYREPVQFTDNRRADELRVPALSQKEAYTKVYNAYKAKFGEEDFEIYIDGGHSYAEIVVAGSEALGNLMVQNSRYLLMALNKADDQNLYLEYHEYIKSKSEEDPYDVAPNKV